MMPFVQENFTFVVLAIIFLSVLPAIIEALRERKRSVNQAEAG
jgi:hypothetical protein